MNLEFYPSPIKPALSASSPFARQIALAALNPPSHTEPSSAELSLSALYLFSTCRASNNMPPSSEAKHGAFLEEKEDEDYDLVDYDAEIGDGDNAQLEREGQLLQAGPRRKNVYAHAVSNLMKKASSKKESAPAKESPTIPRHLVSHESITTLSPELIALIAAECTNYLRKLLLRIFIH
jgi:hypothetical protein